MIGGVALGARGARSARRRAQDVLPALLALALIALLPPPTAVDRVQFPHAASVVGASADAGHTTRRGLWYAIGDAPSVAEVDAAPARYGVVVLNPWDTWALHRIEQADPSVLVLVYKDLASTRSYHRGPAPPTGVGIEEAEARPEWFARDVGGTRIEWDPYPGHWQMAVWDTAYQDRWIAGVVREVADAGWDGVLADNDLATLRWYDSALLDGTTSSDETDAALRAGLDTLVARAGSALQAHGKLLVPNVSEARLSPGRWTDHAAHGGAMEENLAHGGTDADSGFVWDWGEAGWATQTEQLTSAGITLAITRAARDDRRSLLYGFASVLVRGDHDVFWAPSTTDAGTYTEPEWLPEMSIDLGDPSTDGLRGANGAWTRTFTRGWAAVNPTEQAVRLTPPPGSEDTGGRPVGAIELPATSGVILLR